MTTDECRLRAMHAEDLDQVMALETDLFGSSAWSRASYESELAMAGRRYRVVEHRGRVIAYAGIDLSPEATVMTIGVSAEHRRRGIGRGLMTDMLDAALSAGCREVHLEVRASDSGAQRLYASCGFEIIGRRRKYYRGEDALTMQLRLTGAGPVGTTRRGNAAPGGES